MLFLSPLFKNLVKPYTMANHKSAVKRNRQTVARSENNKYYSKTARNAVKNLRTITEKAAAGEMLPKVNSMLDRLAKKNIIHKKNASNLKSSLTKHVNSLS